jgi:hypothetical protein
MPDNWRFSEEEIEQSLRDLGARMEYPPTPEVARTVRLRLDGEEEHQEAHRIRRWPPFLAPRLTAVVAALVLVSVIALAPTVRATLSDFLVPTQQTGSEAGGSAAGPESGGSEDRHKQQAGATSETSAADGGAPGCPSPSIEAKPPRAAAGATFRLSGYDFSSGCDKARVTPARGIRIYLRQAGRTWNLATLDAARTQTFDIRLRVPADAASGRATVLASTSSGARAQERFVVLE